VNLATPHIASVLGLHLPPFVALFLTVGLIAFLFRRDIREKPNVTGGLWLPLVWLVLICSRSVSAWLNIFGFHVAGAASVEEGSPLDAYFYLALATAGFCVLIRRQVSLSEVLQQNGWLMAFIAYCFIAILWSDYPFISLKRWIKILGHPIMALIVLTEPDPKEALIRLMKRCAYIVVPVSVLFIKYYPRWGQAYDQWTGMVMNNGIAVSKNQLGADCMILGYFFFWYLLQTWRSERNIRRRNELRLIAGFLIGIWWLFSRAHSATSLVSFFVGVAMVLFLGLRSTNKKFIGTYLLTAVVLIAAGELAFGLSGRLSEALGRGATMSGRTELWKHLLELHTNPIVGTGFESFWLGDRLKQLEGIFFFIPNEAHNGYLEIYLELGLLGLLLVIGLFIATFWKVRLELFRNFEWGRYHMGFLTAVIFYNWTEAAFGTYSPICFVFYLIAMKYPRPQFAPEQLSVRTGRSEESREFVYAE
jgi:exopolysaccharide production protein ExoQ